MRKNTSGQFPESPGNLSGMKENFFVAQFLALVGGGGGVHQISSDGDNRRSFLGLTYSIQGFFGYENLESIFVGGLIWVGGS